MKKFTLPVILTLCLLTVNAQTSTIDSLHRALSEANDDVKKSLILSSLSVLHSKTSEDSSFLYAVRSMVLAEKTGNAEAFIMACDAFSRYYEIHGDTEKQKDYTLKAYERAKQSDRKSDQVLLSNSIGMICFYQGDYPNAIRYYKISLEMSRLRQNWQNVSMILNNLGNVYYRLGDFVTALNYYMESLRIKEESGSRKEIAATLANIGSVQFKNNEYEKALESYLKSLAIFEELNDKANISLSYNNLGTWYERVLKCDTALDYYFKALKLKEELKDEKGISITYSNIGRTFFSLEEYDKALEYFLKSLKIKEERKDKYGIMVVLFSMSEVYFETDDLNRAIQCLDRSLALAKEIGSSSLLVEIHQFLAKIYALKGDYRQAYILDTISRRISDTLREAQWNRQISELHMKYEVEKTGKENEMLKSNNELQRLRIQRQNLVIILTIVTILLLAAFILILYIRSRHKSRLNRTLKESNEMISLQKAEVEKALGKVQESELRLREVNASKDKFFSLIAHDIKNPFSSVLSLTQLLREDYDTLSDEERKDFINNISGSADSLFKLLENLLQWARIQTGKMEFKPAEIDLAAVIRESAMIMSASASAKNIMISISGDGKYPAWASQPMIMAVIRNLLSNAVKFTPSGGHIVVEITEDDPFWLVHVRDTGIGISTGDLENLFRIDRQIRNKGTENEEGTGLGLILCKEFVEINGGNIRVVSQPDVGSEFTFSVQKVKSEV